eukprot:scaffold2901_cov99-Isochrysis_galbana.AAC.1
METAGTGVARRGWSRNLPSGRGGRTRPAPNWPGGRRHARPNHPKYRVGGRARPPPDRRRRQRRLWRGAGRPPQPRRAGGTPNRLGQARWPRRAGRCASAPALAASPRAGSTAQRRCTENRAPAAHWCRRLARPMVPRTRRHSVARARCLRRREQRGTKARTSPLGSHRSRRHPTHLDHRHRRRHRRRQSPRPDAAPGVRAHQPCSPPLVPPPRPRPGAPSPSPAAAAHASPCAPSLEVGRFQEHQNRPSDPGGSKFGRPGGYRAGVTVRPITA